jgi:hypothetical protein
MKRCPYCGAEYPDSATECAIDKTPFEQTSREPFSLKFLNFGIVAEQKIPLSLSIVSYLFFLPGALFLAFSVFIPFLFLFPDNLEGSIFLACLMDILIGLALLCCFLVFPKSMFIAVGGFVFLLFSSYKSPIDKGETIWPYLAGLGFAVFSVYLSRGLRSCSRGWRTCALILIWWSFASLVYGVIWYFLPNHKLERNADFTALEFYLGTAFSFVYLFWQHRVLTRPKVRELFGI